jgi:hypothetical protein
MVTFIHTSDWRLGEQHAGSVDAATLASLRRTRFDAVRRIGEIARERRAEFVLVTGEVFDGVAPSRETIAEAIQSIAAIGLPVLIVPGGLDERTPSSLWEEEFFIGEATKSAPNLQVVLAGGSVEQSGCLLFPLFSRGAVTSPREAWDHARKSIAAGDVRPRIVIVPTSGIVGDRGFSSVPGGDNAALSEVDYVALTEEKVVSDVAVVTVGRGKPPAVETLPVAAWIAELEHGKVACEFDDLAALPSVAKFGSVDENEAESTSPASNPPPPPTDDNVQFTVFRPQVVAPAKWYDLVAAAHLDASRPEADPAEPTPLERVQAKAKAMLGDRFDDYAPLTHDALQGVPQGSEMTFAFEMAGVEFNPARVSFGWFEDEHTVQVRLRAAPALDGKTARGRMTVFLGAIILADVPFSLRVDAARAADRPKLEPEREAIRRYRRIFASYSHRDLPIVEQFERFVEATGDRYLRDHKVLRAGEAWDDRLLELISEADVFQLFWSRNALASPHVRREWEHALSLGRENFIRPVYWESPLPQAAGLPPEPLTRIHFQFLGAIVPDAEEQQRLSEAALRTEHAHSCDDLLLPSSEDCLEMELGCADFDESEPDLESTGLALEEDGESADFPTEAAMASVSPPSMARVPPPASCPPPVMIEDDLKHSFNAGRPAYIPRRRSSSRGILVGFFIGMVVVSFIMGLIASLLSGE